MKKFKLFLIMVTCAASLNLAEGAGRGSIGFGAWTGKMTQSGRGISSETSANLGLGLPLAVGFSVGPLFIEYAPSFYLGSGIFKSSDTALQDRSELKTGTWDFRQEAAQTSMEKPSSWERISTLIWKSSLA